MTTSASSSQLLSYPLSREIVPAEQSSSCTPTTDPKPPLPEVIDRAVHASIAHLTGGVSPAALAELATFAPNWKSAELLAMFADFRSARNPDQSKRDGFFLQWARAFTAKFSPGGDPTSVDHQTPAAHKPLRSETIEKARKIAPGRDMGELERRWRKWSADIGEYVKSPDAAFLGWLRKSSGT